WHGKLQAFRLPESDGWPTIGRHRFLSGFPVRSESCCPSGRKSLMFGLTANKIQSQPIIYEESVAAPNIETIVSLSKRRGFVFPSSEIYGGLGSAWDYGPLGVELCNNVRTAWWRWMVHERDDMEGLDSSIILNRLAWKYSGHEDTFSDPLVDCRECKSRFRADKLMNDWAQEETAKRTDGIRVLPIPRDAALLKIKCPTCGKTNWTEIRAFN